VSAQVLADAPRLAAVNDEIRAVDTRDDTQALEAKQRGAEVGRPRPLDAIRNR
jgi:hypothetical protein